MEFRDIAGRTAAENSARIRERVMRARQMQTARFTGTDLRFNSDMKAADVERYCTLDDKEKRFMERMFTSMQLSARGYHRIIKVARTIADLEGNSRITEGHLAEAICYRQTEVLK